MIKILIIDDNNDFVETLSEYLQSQKDFEVASASNGKDGIIKTTENPPNVVILDFVMPEFNGTYYLEELQKLNIKKPIIIMTSDFNLKNTSSLLVDLGIDFFLAKPFDFDHLIYTIKKLANANNEQSSRVNDLLSFFDVRYRGTLLIREAIKLVKNNPQLIVDTPRLFELLAEIYNDMDLKKVRDNIDKAILKAWKTHKKEIIKLMNIYDNYKPNLRGILYFCSRNK